ncbi:MAG: M16 family metallopeptidase [Gemmataceae bacterium]
MPFHTHTFANGLTLIGETIPTARSVAVGFFVNTGSRDEVGPESGVSHFLEHMMFKGTARRTALEVNLHLDRIGASSNAYTSEENTVYYAAVLPEYLERAVDILADILRPSLRQDDFDTEKLVILEEISRYDDMPGFIASDNARRIYFGSHPLGNTILGTKETVQALSRDQMQAYFDRRYAAPNIIASVAGQFDWNALVQMIGEKCGHWSGGPPRREFLTEVRGAGGVHIITKEGLNQEHVLAIAAGPPAESMMRYDASTLAIAIGDDSGSRYFWELVDVGVVESASCGVDASQASGLIASSFSCEPGQTAENLATVRQVLDAIQAEGITAEELATAKSKIVSRLVRRSERPMGRMSSIAGSWLYNQEYNDIDRELARYDAVTLDSIRACLDHYKQNELTVIAYGPNTASDLGV